MKSNTVYLRFLACVYFVSCISFVCFAATESMHPPAHTISSLCAPTSVVDYLRSTESTPDKRVLIVGADESYSNAGTGKPAYLVSDLLMNVENQILVCGVWRKPDVVQDIAMQGPHEDVSLDGQFAAVVFEYLPQYVMTEQAFANAARFLRPGGHLLMNLPGVVHWAEKDDHGNLKIRRWPGGVKRVLGDGFYSIHSFFGTAYALYNDKLVKPNPEPNPEQIVRSIQLRVGLVAEHAKLYFNEPQLVPPPNDDATNPRHLYWRYAPDTHEGRDNLLVLQKK